MRNRCQRNERDHGRIETSGEFLGLVLEHKAFEWLRELSALAETAGAVVLDGVLQRRPHPDPATYVGRGKAQELRDIVAAVGADTVIADTELAPSQRRALEDVVKVKVIDRTTVILDIFSQHAKSREGKAQVELAQLEYLLPRLRGWVEAQGYAGYSEVEIFSAGNWWQRDGGEVLDTCIARHRACV